MIYYHPNSQVYLNYYTSQAGGGDLPKFRGQAGYGLGSLLSGFIRHIIPLGFKTLVRHVAPVARSAFNIAKPHLKTAATELTAEAARQITKRLATKQEDEQSGGRKRKTKPAVRKKSTKKGRKSNMQTGGRKGNKSKKKRAMHSKRRRYATNVMETLNDIF